MTPETLKLIEEAKEIFGKANIWTLNSQEWRQVSGGDRYWENRLTEEFIEKYQKRLVWRLVSKYQKLSESFIEKHADKVSWTDISAYQKLSEEFIEKHAGKIDWLVIGGRQNLSKDFIIKYKNRLNWFEIKKSGKYDENFIKTHYTVEMLENSIKLIYKVSDLSKLHRGHWINISGYAKMFRNALTEEFMDKYEDKLIWENISKYQDLSEDFITRHKDKIDFEQIDYTSFSEKFFSDNIDFFRFKIHSLVIDRKMSPDFILKHADLIDFQLLLEKAVTFPLPKRLQIPFFTDNGLIEKLFEKGYIEDSKKNWRIVSQYFYLKEDFIEKYSDKVNWSEISLLQNLSEEFIEKHSDKIEWFYIPITRKLSENFIDRYADDLNWIKVCERQELSEEFIEKHADRVYWPGISKYQKLSEEFLFKHQDKIDIDEYLKNDKSSVNFFYIKAVLNKAGEELRYSYRPLSEHYEFSDYAKKINKFLKSYEFNSLNEIYDILTNKTNILKYVYVKEHVPSVQKKLEKLFNSPDEWKDFLNERKKIYEEKYKDKNLVQSLVKKDFTDFISEIQSAVPKNRFNKIKKAVSGQNNKRINTKDINR